MSAVQGEPQPLFPVPKPFYDFVIPWAWSLANALRGGGPYSLDRALGREL